MSQTELAWAAGFFDGEGHTGGTTPGSTRIKMNVTQIERSTLDRFQRAVRVGKVSTYTKASGQVFYSFDVTNHADVQHVIASLWKYLSQPKRDQAAAALQTSLTEHRRRRALGAGDRGAVPTEACRRGHPWSVTNTRINTRGTRDCRTCQRDRARANYATRREA